MVNNVIRVQLLSSGPLFAVGGWKDVPVDMRHRIVEIKRLILIAGDKIHRQLVHQVRHILLILQLYLLAIQIVLPPLAVRLIFPKNPASLEIQILVKPKGPWSQA